MTFSVLRRENPLHLSQIQQNPNKYIFFGTAIYPTIDSIDSVHWNHLSDIFITFILIVEKLFRFQVLRHPLLYCRTKNQKVTSDWLSLTQQINRCQGDGVHPTGNWWKWLLWGCLCWTALLSLHFNTECTHYHTILYHILMTGFPYNKVLISLLIHYDHVLHYIEQGRRRSLT